MSLDNYFISNAKNIVSKREGDEVLNAMKEEVNVEEANVSPVIGATTSTLLYRHSQMLLK